MLNDGEFSINFLKTLKRSDSLFQSFDLSYRHVRKLANFVAELILLGGNFWLLFKCYVSEENRPFYAKIFCFAFIN